jgi:hypothetical protein
LTGYYSAYYQNAGKKAKNPNELIKELYKTQSSKQTFEEGLKEIEKLKELEKRLSK